MTNHDDETRRKEIIEMAREAGFTDWWINPPEPERKGMCYGLIARLVEIAQAREREACAVLWRITPRKRQLQVRPQGRMRAGDQRKR